MIKEPQVDDIARTVTLFIKIGEQTIEQVVAAFCEDYRFLTLRKMAEILEVDVVKLFECIKLGGLKKYSVTFEKWITDNTYERHPSNVKNLISYPDFIEFMIYECKLEYTKNYLFEDDQGEAPQQNDLCYRKYDPASPILFMHPIIASKSDIMLLLVEVLTGKISLRSLKAIQKENIMKKQTKDGEQPYGNVSISRLGMVADHIKWYFPIKEEEIAKNKTSTRRGVVRLLGSEDHYIKYRDLIYEANKSLIYVRPLPHVKIMKSQSEPMKLMTLGWARKHMPETNIKAEHCDTLVVPAYGAINLLYIDIQNNPKTRLHVLLKG